jgi:hypothetical protein
MKRKKIIPKKEKDKARAKILEAIMNDWFEKNQGLLEDIQELSAKVAAFNAKWRTSIKAKDLFEIPLKH